MVSSSDDEDDFVTYGTSLEPLDEDTIPKKKPITIEDQYATDENGRRRFHGAFTGGFSAGYGNTVGSLEGWKPANFKSSRASRAEAKNQSIFDFMDAEDQSEHGICPMSLKVKPTFDDKTSESSIRKRARQVASEKPIPGVPVIENLLTPVRDTIGVKLLMKMGWKPGQGVGPRVTKKEKKEIKKQREKMKIYGCSLPPEIAKTDSDSGSESEFDINLDDLTFAPDDYKAYIIEPKMNAFGLGYTGMDKKLVLSSGQSSLSKLTVNGKTIRGQAFGVSVFEDDDDDIYNNDDMSNYDFVLAPEQSSSKKTASSEGCIEGFHISLQPDLGREKFPLPIIPADFVPLKSRKFRWDSQEKPATKTRVMNAHERKIIINDEAESELSKMASQVEKQAEVSEERKNVGVVRDTKYSFKPFENDPDKQSRYETFLTFRKLGTKEKLNALQPRTMTAWQKERERLEFEQAARLYRPLSQDMADRFTSGGVQEDVLSIMEPVARTVNLELQTMQEAARKKLFGKLTRKKYSWAPDRILCKRFNIPEPVESSLEKAAENTQTKSRKSASIFEFLKSEVATAGCPNYDYSETETPCASTSSKTEETIECKTEVEIAQGDVVDEIDRKSDKDGSASDDEVPDVTNKVDLFKAIFLSSSEDEEEDENESPEKSNPTLEDSETKEKLLSRIQYSPPRGIFANIDLDCMRSRPSVFSSSKNVESVSEKTMPEKPSEKDTEQTDSKIELYGPVLPAMVKPVQVDKSHRAKKSKTKEKKEKWVEKSHKHKKHKKHKNKYK